MDHPTFPCCARSSQPAYHWGIRTTMHKYVPPICLVMRPVPWMPRVLGKPSCGKSSNLVGDPCTPPSITGTTSRTDRPKCRQITASTSYTIPFPSPTLPVTMLQVYSGIAHKWLASHTHKTPIAMGEPPITWSFLFYVVDASVPVLAKCQPQMEFSCCMILFFTPAMESFGLTAPRFLTPGHPLGMSI